jgi:adenylate cyclase
MKDQARRLTSRTVMRAMRTLPGPVVQRMVALWAPLARYGGASKGGAMALSRAISLLAEPPITLHAGDRPLSLADIAARVGRSAEEVERWAQLGLLGEPEGDPALWGAEAAERARLVDYLRHRGVSEEELREATAQRRVPLLAIDRTVAGRATLTLDEVARRTGVEPAFAAQVWRALGLPPGEPGEMVYTRRDLEGIRVLAAMRSIFADEDLLEAASVLGLAMSQVAASNVELFRRRVGTQLPGLRGNLDAVLRNAAMVDLMLPTVGVLLEQVHRRHLEAAVRGESVEAVEEAEGALPGQVDLCVGFADLVGFTAASETLQPMQVGEMAGALVRHAEEALPRHGARIVKTLGDAVMFTAPDAPAGAAAAVALMERAASDAGLPELRIGSRTGRCCDATATSSGGRSTSPRGCAPRRRRGRCCSTSTAPRSATVRGASAAWPWVGRCGCASRASTAGWRRCRWRGRDGRVVRRPRRAYHTYVRSQQRVGVQH